MDKIRLVGSGAEWMLGEDVVPIEDAMVSLISSAQDCIEMTMFSIWTGFEFVDRIWDSLDDAVNRGVHIYLVINDFHNQSSKAAMSRVGNLKSMGRDTVGVRSFNGLSGTLHAKVLVVDEDSCIISSSNQSDKGYAKNHELGVQIEGKRAKTASRMFRKLYSSKKCSSVIDFE